MRDEARLVGWRRLLVRGAACDQPLPKPRRLQLPGERLLHRGCLEPARHFILETLGPELSAARTPAFCSSVRYRTGFPGADTGRTASWCWRR